MIILSDLEMVTGLLSLFFFLMIYKTIVSTYHLRRRDGGEKVVMEVIGRGTLNGIPYSLMGGTILLDSARGINTFSLKEMELKSGIERSYNW